MTEQNVLVTSLSVQVTSELGRVDMLVNNAGIVTGRKFLDCPDSLVLKTMQVNAISHFWVGGSAFGNMRVGLFE